MKYLIYDIYISKGKLGKKLRPRFKFKIVLKKT